MKAPFSLATILLFAFPCFSQEVKALPDAPKPKLDRRIFIAGVSLLAVSQAADAITTRSVLNRGGFESNPIYGLHPSPARQAGINAALFTARATIFYFTERSRHRWIRWTGRSMLGMVIVNHSQLAICASTAPRYRRHGESCHDISPF